ncbi:MAG: hypothetical protein EBY92_03830, partial [Actinobacteria bacterium]|nr:hypothetical protein [Actinomycetota bacterium]
MDCRLLPTTLRFDPLSKSGVSSRHRLVGECATGRLNCRIVGGQRWTPADVAEADRELTIGRKQHAEWRDGIYENRYVREEGVWKIASLHLYVNFQVAYEKGWARLKPGEGLAPSATSVSYPPDR